MREGKRYSAADMCKAKGLQMCQAGLRLAAPAAPATATHPHYNLGPTCACKGGSYKKPANAELEAEGQGLQQKMIIVALVDVQFILHLWMWQTLHMQQTLQLQEYRRNRI